MSSKRKEIVRRYFEDVLTTARLETADELLTDDVRVVAPGSDVRGIPALKEMLSAAGSAFPHRDLELEEPIEDGDRIACIFRLAMEHVGEHEGLPATGRTVDITGIDVFTFSGDRISEILVFYNALSVMEQLGVAGDAAG